MLPLEAIRAVVPTVDPVVVLTVALRAETAPGLPPLLLALLPQLMGRASREEEIDAPTTRDARITKRAVRARLKAERTKGGSPARSLIRTHGSTSITTLRDPSLTTRSR
jgi:hypothetical protein